jgi:hypothetical protein
MKGDSCTLLAHRPNADIRRCATDASSELLRETLDLFLTRKAAEAELREILEDEPDWKDVLRVVPIELDGRNVSPN